MPKKHFSKPTLSLDAQVDLLQQRGLHIPDKARAKHYLQYISYYRLSIYGRSLQQSPATTHQFIQGASFDDILYRYRFDRELRLLVLDAIERIEVALRSRIVYVFSEAFGANWYADAGLFRQSKYFDHAKEMQHIQQLCMRSKELFMQHHQQTYHDLPPSWKLLEAMSLGEVERLYANTDASQKRVKNARYNVAQSFGIAPNLLLSWFKPLCLLRNICAHHGRLWNRKLIYRPQAPKNPHIAWVQHEIENKQQLYMYLCVVQSLMSTINPHSSWRQRLLALLDKYTDIPQADMGFPVEWQDDAFWMVKDETS